MKSKDNIFVKQTGTKYDSRYLLSQIKLYEGILVDLGSWASAALDDPKVCNELKGIFKRVVDVSVDIIEERGGK